METALYFRAVLGERERGENRENVHPEEARDIIG